MSRDLHLQYSMSTDYTPIMTCTIHVVGHIAISGCRSLLELPRDIVFELADAVVEKLMPSRSDRHAKAWIPRNTIQYKTFVTRTRSSRTSNLRRGYRSNDMFNSNIVGGKALADNSHSATVISNNAVLSSLEQFNITSAYWLLNYPSAAGWLNS